MNAAQTYAARFRLAIALSIAAHLCVAWLLAALFGDRQMSLSSELDSSAIPRVTMFVQREIVPRRHRMAVPVAVLVRPVAAERKAPPPARKPAARAAFKPVRTAMHAPAKDGVPTAPLGRSPSAPPRLTLAVVAPLPTATPTPVPTAVVATPTPAPTPSATATPKTPVVAANFGGLFSQDYPPALADRADLDGVRSRLPGPVRIQIDVDETGRATDVRFMRPPLDAALAQEIRSALLGLRYVPADCNGLHCDGTLEISY